MFFCKKKKTNTTATVLKVVAVILGVIAVAAGLYLLYDKVLKKKLAPVVKKKKNGCRCNDLCIGDFEDLGEAFDIDGDGNADAVLVDTTGNGELDTILADTTGDGVVDTIIQ